MAILKMPLVWFVVAVIGLGVYAMVPRAPAQQAVASAMVEVAVPDLTARQQAGKEVFDANCASCHGANAAGRHGFGPPLIHKIYEPSHHGDAGFVHAVKQGSRQHHWPFGNMPPVPGITDDQIADITDYVRAVQRANGID